MNQCKADYRVGNDTHSCQLPEGHAGWHADYQGFWPSNESPALGAEIAFHQRFRDELIEMFSLNIPEGWPPGAPGSYTVEPYFVAEGYVEVMRRKAWWEFAKAPDAAKYHDLYVVKQSDRRANEETAKWKQIRGLKEDMDKVTQERDEARRTLGELVATMNSPGGLQYVNNQLRDAIDELNAANAKLETELAELRAPKESDDGEWKARASELRQQRDRVTSKLVEVEKERDLCRHLALENADAYAVEIRSHQQTTQLLTETKALMEQVTAQRDEALCARTVAESERQACAVQYHDTCTEVRQVQAKLAETERHLELAYSDLNEVHALKVKFNEACAALRATQIDYTEKLEHETKWRHAAEDSRDKAFAARYAFEKQRDAIAGELHTAKRALKHMTQARDEIQIMADAIANDQDGLKQVIAAMTEVHGWIPISTPPKMEDGSSICTPPVVVFRHEEIMVWIDAWNSRAHTPTHWARIPAPTIKEKPQGAFEKWWSSLDMSTNIDEYTAAKAAWEAATGTV